LVVGEVKSMKENILDGLFTRKATYVSAFSPCLYSGVYRIADET